MGLCLQYPIRELPNSIPGILQNAAGFYLPEAVEHPAARRSCRPNSKNFPEAVQISLGVNLRVGKQGLWLRAKYKGVPLYGIEKRFDPHSVPAEKQAVTISVPYCKGKNSVELFRNFHAIFHISIEYDLCITGSLKAAAPADEIPFQLLGIINFPVIDNGIFPFSSLTHHWLGAAGQIPNG